MALQVEDGSGNPLGTVITASSGLAVDLPGPLAAGTYYVEVSGVGGAMNTYSLGIDRDAANPAQVYYVNDGSQVNDYYTLAPGNDANNGLTPQTPKATLQSVLNTYGLTAGNLVVIDTGTYTTATTISSANEGAAYAGSPGGSDFTYGGTRFELTDSNANEFYGLVLGGGGTGFSAMSGSQRNAFLNNTFTGTYTAISIGGGASDLIENNTISGNSSYGIYLTSEASATVSGNTISGSGTAIYASGGSVVVNDNTLSSASYGVNFSTTAGTISNNSIVTNLSSGYGIYNNGAASIFNNTVSESYVGIDSYGAAALYGNTIDSNATGLYGSGTFGGTSWSAGQPNDINDNTTGVQLTGAATVYFNKIHGNSVGILVSSAGGTVIQNNLIYRNTGQGILVQGANGVTIASNTIYTPAGDGVRIMDSSSNVGLQNNIIWTNSGYDIYVATDSQVGFTSDYNDLYTTNPGDPSVTPGTAALVWFEEAFTDLFNWQVESNYDVHSIGYTAPAPTLDNPQFVNLAGDEYQLSVRA